MGCWVNTRPWTPLISFPHTAISLNPAGSPMAWEAALAIPKRTSGASCSCLKHIHHMASCEGGGITLGIISMPLGSALAWFLAMFERQVHQQHTARRAHERSFVPPPPPGGKVDLQAGWICFCWIPWLCVAGYICFFPVLGFNWVSLPWTSAFLRTSRTKKPF